MFFRLTNLFVSILCASGLSVIGCGGAKVPEGFPQTLPFTITVVNDGKPIEGVNVRLSTTMDANWTAAGMTDVSGIAELQTISGSYARKGVPEGSYKVILSKPYEIDSNLLGPIPDLEDTAAMAVYNAKVDEMRNKMTLEVPTIYSQNRTTPASIEVTKGKNQETIDVGKQ